MRIRAALACVALLVALSACGGSETAAGPVGSPDGRAGANGSSTGSGGGDDETADDGVGAKSSGGTATPSTDVKDGGAAAASTTPDMPDGPPADPTGIVRSVKPKCAARTQVIEVTAKTVPLADISYAASFADGQHHGVFGIGQAGVDGTWVLTIPVAPDVAFGDGQVLAAAIHPDGGGGDGKGPFRITKDGSC